MKILVNSIFVILGAFSPSPVIAADATTRPTMQGLQEPQPTLHETQVASGKKIQFLLTEPSKPTEPEDRWVVVFLYGAGGSLHGYNISRPQYAKIRQSLAEHGAYLVVPELGGSHFMNDKAKETLTSIIDQVLKDEQIDRHHVHLMGTSMGAGSSLAYAVNFPDRVRSVCAIFPMTDFAEWVRQNPKYTDRLKEAYGGTVEETREAYDANSAMKHVDALAKIPVMLIHGTEDKTVPLSNSEDLAAAMKAKGYACTFLKVNGIGHSDDIVTNIQDQIATFLIDANADHPEQHQ